MNNKQHKYLSFTMDLTVTFVLENEFDSNDYKEIVDLMDEVPDALSEPLSDVLECEALALPNGARVYKVATTIANMKTRGNTWM